MGIIEYIEYNHPKQAGDSICYLCGKPRNGEKSEDHVIPQKLFPKGCVHRPYLYVHGDCNGGKSKDDKKFVLRMQVLCNRNETAQAEVMAFAKRANQEAGNAWLIGKSNQLKNYKLKRTITNEMAKKFDFMYNGEHMVEVAFTDEHVQFMERYAIQMARGLFVRNVPGAVPNMAYVKTLWLDYHMLQMRGLLHKSMQSIKHTVSGARQNGTLFGQAWRGIVEYYGGKTNDEGTSGWIYIHFYTSYAVWVHFASEAELAMAKGIKWSL